LLNKWAFNVIFFLILPRLLSFLALTVGKLVVKLDAAGSGLWHMSLWYKLFVLNRGKANVTTSIRNRWKHNHAISTRERSLFFIDRLV